MDEKVIRKLLDINKLFYQTFGDDFSATRGRIQPGVREVLHSLSGSEKILDLGCGNGEAASELSKLGHQGEYIGIDLSMPMIEIARQKISGEPFNFLRADLSSKDWGHPFHDDSFDVVFAFATLHHFPSRTLRQSILRTIARVLKPNGTFIHSNWQFLKSPRLKARIQPWEMAGLDKRELEEGDYLLDWKRGGTGLRYVHHFNENELKDLACQAGFEIINTFHSDGYEINLSIYQSWKFKSEKLTRKNWTNNSS